MTKRFVYTRETAVKRVGELEDDVHRRSKQYNELHEKCEAMETFIKSYDAFIGHPCYGDWDGADEKETDELLTLERAMRDARAAIED